MKPVVGADLRTDVAVWLGEDEVFGYGALAAHQSKIVSNIAEQDMNNADELKNNHESISYGCASAVLAPEPPSTTEIGQRGREAQLRSKRKRACSTKKFYSQRSSAGKDRVPMQMSPTVERIGSAGTINQDSSNNEQKSTHKSDDLATVKSLRNAQIKGQDTLALSATHIPYMDKIK
ncbi:hypothetical protein ACLOJK_020891 [Asimina triloba]